MTRKCEIPGCARRGQFGWGSPVVWLCLAHLDAALTKAAEVVAYWRGTPALAVVPDDEDSDDAESQTDPHSRG